MNMPGFTWMYILQAASLSELGRKDEARSVIADLVSQYPDFPANAREAIANYIYESDLVDRMMVSLENAGLFEESILSDP